METITMFATSNWLTIAALGLSVITPLVFLSMKYWEHRTHKNTFNKQAIESARKRTQILREVAELELQWNNPIRDCRHLKSEIKRCYYGNEQDEIIHSIDELEKYCLQARNKITQTYQALVNKEAFYDPILLEQKTPTLYKIAQKSMREMDEVNRRIMQIRNTISTSTFFFRPLQRVS